MQNKTVKIAGKEYEIRPLPIRRAREVRQRLAAPFGQAIQALKNAQETEISDLRSVGETLEAIKSVLIDSVEICLDLICDYSPEIAADRELIESEGYDEEVIRAALEAIKMLFPFGGLTSSLSGLAELAKSTNSRSASGESGPTS